MVIQVLKASWILWFPNNPCLNFIWTICVTRQGKCNSIFSLLPTCAWVCTKRSIRRRLPKEASFVYIVNVVRLVLSIKTSDVVHLLNSIRLLDSCSTSFSMCNVFLDLEPCFKASKPSIRPFWLFLTSVLWQMSLEFRSLRLKNIACNYSLLCIQTLMLFKQRRLKFWPLSSRGSLWFQLFLVFLWVKSVEVVVGGGEDSRYLTLV